MNAVASPGLSVYAGHTDTLHRLLLRAGRSKIAIIGSTSVFLPIHDNVLYAAPTPQPGEIDFNAMQPLRSDSDLEAFGLQNHLPAFLQAPVLFCTHAKQLGNRFAAQLVNRLADVAEADKRSQLLDIGRNFLRIEAALSDDGPGSCMIAEGWIVWADGIDGLASILAAPNRGDRPDPDMGAALRWTDAHSLPDADRSALANALRTMTSRFEIRSFSNRLPPRKIERQDIR